MKKPLRAIPIIIIISLGVFCTQAIASKDSYYIKTAVISKIDLRKYFEEAMALFEAARYREAVTVFEKLIEIEKEQGEAYFTPFAEIYIEKSKARMADMMMVRQKKLERIKKDVIDEATRIAQEQKENIAREEERKRRVIEEEKKKQAAELELAVDDTYSRALQYYRDKNYPAAIVEFKKIKELDPEHPLVAQAESYIHEMQGRIKEAQEKAILVRMEEAHKAKIEMERQEKRKEFERARKERQKRLLRIVFEQKLRAKEAQERIIKVSRYADDIIRAAHENNFEQAESLANQAMQEFPEHERFKELAHFIEIQKIKMEEGALKRVREITEEKMLLDVAKKHLLPEEKTASLEKEKKITPLVKVPEIRKRLKIPISVDFKDVELDYVLSFLSDATGVNIVPSSEIDISEKKVSIKIKDMPLEEALKYILKAQDLTYRIEEDAVWVATKDELKNEKIETRVYFLNQGIGRFAEFTSAPSSESKSANISAASGESSSTSSRSTSSEVKTIKNVLEDSVDWPKDSKLTLDDRTGALIASNTPSNLEVIENLLYNLDVTPIQVLIEARFLEVKVTDVDELGFEWKLNSAWGAQQTSGHRNIHGFVSNSGVDFSSFTRGDEGFNLTYQGVLSHPQFQAVLHALQEKQNVKTLSVPSVTTLNNQAATIEVIDEYIYPTRYEASLVQYDINGDGDFDDAGETEWANIPQDFVTRDVGILLHVKPSVGVDKKTITLALNPEVSEDAGSYTYSGSVTIPKFKTRTLSTSVIIKDGETVVLGGLIKESNTKVKTKVPFLGDIPLIGSLFRKTTDDTERRNLLIFITARVVNKKEEIMASAQKDVDIGQ